MTELLPKPSSLDYPCSCGTCLANFHEARAAYYKRLAEFTERELETIACLFENGGKDEAYDMRCVARAALSTIKQSEQL